MADHEFFSPIKAYLKGQRELIYQIKGWFPMMRRQRDEKRRWSSRLAFVEERSKGFCFSWGGRWSARIRRGFLRCARDGIGMVRRRRCGGGGRHVDVRGRQQNESPRAPPIALGFSQVTKIIVMMYISKTLIH